MRREASDVGIKVLIADDHKIVREGLRALLDGETDMSVCGEAEDGRTAVETARKLRPGVVLMDVVMPDLDGVQATRQIVAACSGTKVIALSMHADRRFVEGMLEEGAKGYLLKECPFEELARAIRTVTAGKTYLSPGIAGVVVEDCVRCASRTRSPGKPTLTPREHEVLQLLAEGKTTNQVACCLSVSAKTVRTHRQHIVDKLSIRGLAGLTKYAIRQGMTTLEA